MKKLLATAVIFGLAACGSVDGSEEEGTTNAGTETQTEETTSVEETETEDPVTEEPTESETNLDTTATQIRVSVPDDWKLIDKDGFAFHYMWEGNDWDDILSQRFEPPYPPFEPDEYVSILENNLAGHEAGSPEVTYREDVTIGGHDGFVLDVDWANADTLTSLTYLDVGGVVWELTANATEADGLAVAEDIIATAEFRDN